MQDNRESILIAAIEQFNISGIQSASISSIAKAAGISKGTLYYYYPAKEDLVSGAFEYVRANAQRLSLSNIPLSSPEQTVKQLVRDAFIWPMRYPSQMRFMDSYISLYFYDKQAYSLFTFDILGETTISSEMRSAIRQDVPLELLNFLLGNTLTLLCKYAITHPEYPGNDEFIESSANIIWDMLRR